MATATKQVLTREMADVVMRRVDEATKATLAAMRLEAYRFDADVCIEEQWMTLKVMVRPMARA